MKIITFKCLSISLFFLVPRKSVVKLDYCAELHVICYRIIRILSASYGLVGLTTSCSKFFLLYKHHLFVIYENYTSETIYTIDFIILAFVLQNNSRKGKQIVNHLSHPFSSTSNNVLCCLDNDLFMTDRELINSVNTSKADLNN